MLLGVNSNLPCPDPASSPILSVSSIAARDGLPKAILGFRFPHGTRLSVASVLPLAHQDEPEGGRPGGSCPDTGLSDNLPVLVQKHTVGLEDRALAAFQHAGGHVERLRHSAPCGSRGFVEPHRIHIPQLRCRVAPPHGLQLVAAIGGQDQPGGRQRLSLGVDERVIDRHRVSGCRGIARYHILSAIPVRQGKNEGGQVVVGLHDRVFLHVVQGHLCPLVPEGFSGKVPGFIVGPGEHPGRHAGHAQELAAGFPLHVLRAPGRHGAAGILRVHMVPTREVVPKLRHNGGYPALQRGGKLGGRDVLPAGNQAHDVHQLPLHGQAVVAGLPAAGILVIDALGLVLHRAVRQSYSNGYWDALALLDGAEHAALAAGLKPPVQVVHGQGAGAVGQRQAGKIDLLVQSEPGQDRAVPLLIQTRNNLRHPQAAARP